MFKTKSYTLGILLSVGIVFALTGCGDKAQKTVEKSEVAAEKKATPKPRGLPVKAVPVIVGEIVNDVTAVGTIVANESVKIRTEINGRLVGVHFEEGQDVIKGQKLVSLEDSEHIAQVAAISAELRTEKQRFVRSKELYEQKFISKEALDLQAGAVDRLSALEQEASARHQKTIVKAPFSGVIGLRKVSPGAYLRAGDDIAILENTKMVKVDFRVPEVYLGKVKSGQRISVMVDAYPDSVFEGIVYASEAGIDQQTRTALLRGKIENQSGRLRPGMFARVSLVLSSEKNALSVPEQALWPQGTENFVYKVIDGKVALTKVTLGQRNPGYVQIVSGLSSGDIIVTEGQIKIRDGAPVTVLGN